MDHRTQSWFMGYGWISAMDGNGSQSSSIGVQSYNSQMLKMLDRIHLVEDVNDTLTEMNRLRMNFSIDLMIGLPKSSEVKRNIREELLRLIDFGPSHFSVYILTAKSGYKLIDHIPEDELIADEYLTVVELLAQHGYEQYEVSNFAKLGKQSRHNQRYWNGQTVLAVGPSATGLLMQSEQVGSRYKWRTQVPKFDVERLSAQELCIERLFLGLRTSKGIDVSDYASGEKQVQIKRLLDKWSHQGLGIWRGRNFSLLPRGYLIMDSLLGSMLPIL